jgi:aminopeptidase N
MKVYLLIIISLYSLSIQGQNPQKNYNSLHIKAEMYINPYLKQVKGDVEYTLQATKNTNQIKIDAPGIKIIKVKRGFFNQSFDQNDKYLYIKRDFKKGKKYTFRIKYIAHPHSAMYFTGWKYPNARKQVWTQGQGKGNSHWIPVNEDQNDKFSWDLSIIFHKNYQVVSNGILADKKSLNDSLTQWNYKQNQPAPSYLMFIGTGKFLDKSFMSSSGINIHNYQYPDAIKNDKTYYKSREIVDFLEKEIGVSFPWKVYRQIPLKDFLYGGMENLSVSSFNGNRYVVDSIEFNDRNFVNVSAHELAHQWFGDLVTGKNSSDHWLHEGFATYYARLNDQQIFGKDYAEYEILKFDQLIKKATKTDTIPIHRPNASSLSYYQKGARVVQMLRQKTGDFVYKKTIQAFLHKYRFKNASIANLQHEFYLQTGDSLNNFFDLWLDTTHIPSLILKHKSDSIIFVKNELPQDIPFLFIYKDSLIDKSFSNSFKIPSTQNLLSIVPNTGNNLLCHIDFKKPESWIIHQVLESPYFSDRYIGLKELIKRRQGKIVIDSLLAREEFFPINTLIAKDALQNHDLQTIKKLFKKDLKTRQYLAQNLDPIPLELKKNYRSLLADSSYVTKEAVLWKYAKNFPKERIRLLEDTKNIKGDRNKSFRLTWLGIAIVSPEYRFFDKKKFLDETISYTSGDYNFDVRLNAFYLLSSLRYYTKEAIRNLMDACIHFNWHFHQPARKLLKELYTQREYESLILSLLKERPEEQKKFFKKLLNVGKL